MSDAGLRNDKWRLCECAAWPGNDSYRQLVSWCWSASDARHLVGVNLSDAPAQARVRLLRADLAERLTGRRFRRAGDERVGRPVRGPRPLGIELPGARALTPSSASRRARGLDARQRPARTRSLPIRGSERKPPGQGARSRRRGPGGSAAPRPRPRRSCSWSGRGVPATGPAQRVRQPWRLR